MHENNSFKSKLSAFAEGKGFYIVLLLCLAAIGISGYVLFFLPQTTQTDLDMSLDPGLPSAAGAETGSMPEIPDVTVALEPEPAQPDPAPAVSKPQTAIPAEPAPVQADAEEDLTETWIFHKPKAYTWPVSGDIIRPYSPDVLLYDETMGDWRTHTGIDLACAPGDAVCAMAEGVISAVEEDLLLGTIVRITHEEELESIYIGLDPAVSVSPGDAVEQGQTIGTAGNTNKTESLLECHVHLEVRRKGSYIDPESLQFE